MQKLMAIAGAVVLIGTTAHAQEGAAPAAPAASNWKCGPNGYARPYYGQAGDNDGIGAPYEDASPCTPQILKDAAEAIGMGRDFPLGIKNVPVILYRVNGTLAPAPGKKPVPIDKVDVQLNYFLPAARVALTTGGATTIRVTNDDYNWSEKSEGVFQGPLPATTHTDLTPFWKLTPVGAMLSVIDAEGNAKVSTVAGHTVVSGASPYDHIPETVTFDDKNRPIEVTARINGHLYAAKYDGWSDKWEPHYLVIFPEKMTWTVDGKPYADLTVTAFRSNPYAIFAVPAALPKTGTPRPTLLPEPVNDVWTPPAKRILPYDGFMSQVKPKGTTPRMADGHPDLTGQWGGGFPNPAGPGHVRHMGTLEPDQMVLQRSAYLDRPLYKPEYWDKVRSLAFSKVDVDPVYRCHFAGVPRQGPPAWITASPKQIWTMNQAYAGVSTRVIPTDGRKRPDGDGDFTFSLGLPLGHWEGDTLVVESVGFNDSTWFGYDGYFHTERMKVTETLRRDGDILYYTYKVDDPDVLAEPYQSRVYVKRLVTDPEAVPGQAEECTEMDLKSMRDVYERG